MDIYEEYLAQKYEGIIIRHPFKTYERKRSKWIMKFKPKKTDLYKIIGVNQAADVHGNLKNMMGAFECKGDDGTEFNVGAGMLTHPQREFYWNNPEHAIGKDCLVQYQNINSKSGRPIFGLCVEVI
jgi:ATP-dependent DNA ligase